jgi:hypothetical protein
LITFSCIFFNIFASDFSLITVIVNATMFLHAHYCLFVFRYISLIRIWNNIL